MSQFKPGGMSRAIPARRQMARPTTEAYLPVGQSSGVFLAVEAEPTLEQTEQAESVSTSMKGALAFTLLFMFFRFSFLHELIGTRLGVDFHFLLVLGGGAVITSFLSGALLVGVRNRISIVWFIFTGFLIFASIFSLWRGGSFEVLYPFLRTTLILVVLIPAVTQSRNSLTKVMKTIGIAGLSLIVVGLTANDFRTGRLELTGAGSSASNSNDYAAYVILVMPAIAYLTLRRGSRYWLKLIGFGALACGCFLVLSTGSRGALISMGLSTLYLLKLGSWKLRGAILVGLPTVALVAIPFLPGQAATRLTSLFSSKSDTEESAASQAQRTALLMESVKATLRHPLLGVGPGTFQEYQAQLAGENGERGMWHETHNSYTQVSSECGIPAFICYVSAIFMAFSVFGRGRKSIDPDIREVSTVLSLTLVSFSICMFFLAQGYGFAFPVMGGIAIAIDNMLKREKSAAMPLVESAA